MTSLIALLSALGFSAWGIARAIRWWNLPEVIEQRRQAREECCKAAEKRRQDKLERQKAKEKNRRQGR